MRRFVTHVLAAATDAGVRLEADVRLGWLTRSGHLGAEAQRALPPAILAALAEIFAALGGDERLLAAKTRGAMTADFLHSGGQLVELDEVQHFTRERARTLARYPPDVSLAFSLDEYRKLCARWHPRAERAYAHRTAPEFPFAGGRRAQRAYFDAFRDLAAPWFGHGPVLRVPAPEADPALAAARLTAAVDKTNGGPTAPADDGQRTSPGTRRRVLG